MHWYDAFMAKLWIMTNLSFKQNIIVIFHLHKALGDSTEKIISFWEVLMIIELPPI